MAPEQHKLAKWAAPPGHGCSHHPTSHSAAEVPLKEATTSETKSFLTMHLNTAKKALDFAAHLLRWDYDVLLNAPVPAAQLLERDGLHSRLIWYFLQVTAEPGFQ